MMRIPESEKRVTWIVSAATGMTLGLTALINALYLKAPLVLTVDELMFLALMVAIFPPAVVNLLDGRWRNAVDNAIPKFLRELSEAGRTGVTLTRAIELASKRKYGPLSGELKRIVAHLSWGLSLEEALKRFAERVNTRLARRTAILISEISRAGGEVQEILETVSRHINELQTVERERRSQIRPYITIVYIAFFIFLFVDIMLIKTFFSELEHMKGVMAEAGGMFLASALDVGKVEQVMFHITILEGFYGGLIAGKVGEGSIGAGLKHSLAMMAIGFLAFYLIVWKGIAPP
jgi:flagellar protein FlaJ